MITLPFVCSHFHDSYCHQFVPLLPLQASAKAKVMMIAIDEKSVVIAVLCC